jgi:hypothetical protein
MGRAMHVFRWTTFLGCCAIATLAACGGGNAQPTPSVPSSSGSSASPTVVYTALPQATLAPFNVAQTSETVPVPASTDANAPQITIALPSTSLSIEEMDLSADDAVVPDATTVDASVTNEALTDAPAPTGATRAAASIRATEAAKAVRTHIETVSVKFSKRVSLKTRPTFVFTFASGFLIAANYYLQFYDTSRPGLGWQDPFEGPATIDGSTLLFVDTKNAFTFEAGVKYYFDLYAVSVRSTPTPFPATPTPLPTATPVPTATPSPIFGLLTVTPTSVSFDAPDQTESLDVSEEGYSGNFSAKVNDTTLATLTNPSPGVFALTSTANPGRSSVTVSDEHGQTVSVPFTVTITTGTISAIGHRSER